MRKCRFRRALLELIAVLILGAGYLCFFLKFGVGIQCLFRKLTGLKCPGCGMTHAIANLCRGNIKQALEDNVLVLNVLPVFSLYLLYRNIRYINGTDEGFYIWEYALLFVLFVATVGYGIMRNIM